MNIVITINTDNAAFVNQGLEAEVARILRDYARQLDDGLLNVSIGPRRLRDINGDMVGTVEVTEPIAGRCPTCDDVLTDRTVTDGRPSYCDRCDTEVVIGEE